MPRNKAVRKIVTVSTVVELSCLGMRKRAEIYSNLVPGVQRVTVRGPTNPDASSKHGLHVEALELNAGAVADDAAAQPNVDGAIWEQNKI